MFNFRNKLSPIVCVLTLFFATSISHADDPAVPEPKADQILVFKKERELYLLHNGTVLAAYAGLRFGANPQGHKTQEGDERTPEGEYFIDGKKANSDFYKAVKISYPNEADEAQAEARGVSPGGRIMIHGYPNGVPLLAMAVWDKLMDWTDGCIAVSNTQMDQIWSLVDIGTRISIFPNKKAAGEAASQLRVNNFSTRN